MLGDVLDETETAGTRAERRDHATAETRAAILDAARACLLADGYANLSTRRVAEAATSRSARSTTTSARRQQLILAVLAAENERLIARQRSMFDTPEPLWVRWELACDFLDADVASGYVRILQEMIAAGWSDAEVAAAVRALVGEWYRAPRRRGAARAGAGRRLRRLHPRRGRGADGHAVPRRRGAILLGVTEARSRFAPPCARSGAAAGGRRQPSAPPRGRPRAPAAGQRATDSSGRAIRTCPGSSRATAPASSTRSTGSGEPTVVFLPTW